jgi:hypothetical protein
MSAHPIREKEARCLAEASALVKIFLLQNDPPDSLLRTPLTSTPAKVVVGALGTRAGARRRAEKLNRPDRLGLQGRPGIVRERCTSRYGENVHGGGYCGISSEP